MIVCRNGAQLTERDVIQHCRNELATFKCPKHVLFVEELPKTPSGKILKRDLREMCQSILLEK